MTDIQKLKEEIEEFATDQQRRAADPERSVWVEASAGTGKTKVLSDRVLRLLLNGVEPIRLLCLTYTKAAAVEMQTRVSKRLSEWAVEDKKTLEDNLTRLLGNAVKSADELSAYCGLARTLFAKLLDTPGGIKVQTLHSFCADVLKRFPLEAGISPYFSVLDDEETQNALAQIKIAIIQSKDNLENPELSQAVNYFIANMSEQTFDSMLKKIIESRLSMAKIIAKNNGLSGFLGALAAKLNVNITDTEESLKQEFMDSLCLRRAEFLSYIDALMHGSPKKDKEKALKLAQVVEHDFRLQDYEKYKSCYFGSNNQPYKVLATKDAVNYDPQLTEKLTAELWRLEALENKMLKLRLFFSTKAAFTIAAEINRRYDAYKAERACMDFEDLIYHTRRLLAEADARQWVLYKLDGGIDHILLDEAQDTSSDQWDIVSGLCDDFFSGEGQSENNRTLFVVGDRKQSIYSFQGADPEKFDKISYDFEKKAKEAHKDFQRINLEISFRSAPAILDAVNKIFATHPAADGVVSETQKVEHKPFRVGQFGKVTIMPIMLPEKDQKTHTENEYLQPPMERVYKTALVTKIAETVAHQIRCLMDQSATTDKPLHYRDIMVLVRRRNDFVGEFIRACEKEGVRISGADRLKLSDQIAIDDLISLGKFLLFPKDNLSLAEVLTSPLFSIDENLLEDLCYGRGENDLWTRIQKDSRCTEIKNSLKTLLDKLDYVRPYELFNYVLSTMGGRRKFVRRMGQEVEDALDEFINITLDYEQHQTPSLQGFISWFGQCDREIKRESDDPEIDAVRLCTVHHSKGLQAPIVILPDTNMLPNGSRKQQLLQDDSLGYYPLNSAAYDDICGELNDKIHAREMLEYHRLLYVALTRAENELYIYAYGNKNQEAWYNLCREALAEPGTDEKEPIELISTAEEVAKDDEETPEPPKVYRLEEWIDQSVEAESALSKPYTPSKEESDEEPDSASPLIDNGKFYRRGTLIHRLLQFLPQNSGNREDAIDTFLQQNSENFSLQECKQIKTEVLQLLKNPEFAEIFGADSQAEVPIMGEVDGKILSAQIDRLIILPDKIKIVDFKTNRPPAKTVAETPPQYIKQLEAYAKLARKIYPQKQIETFILWTNETRLMKVA